MKNIFIIFFVIFTIYACGGGNASQEAEISTANLSQQYITLLDEADTQFDAFKESLSEDEAKQALVDWLNAQSNIEDAGLSEDGNNIWFNSTDGINMNILTYSNPFPDMRNLAPPTTIKKPNNNFKKSLADYGSTQPGAQWLFMYAPFYWEQVSACYEATLSADCLSNEDFPFDDYSGIRDLKAYYKDPLLGIAPYAVSYIDEQADADALAGIFAMATSPETHIYISTHGGQSQQYQNNFSYFFTGQKATIDVIAERIADFASGKLCIAHYNDEDYVAITPTFVESSLQEVAAFAGSPLSFHVFVAACRSYESHLKNAFMNNGAKSFMGFSGLATHQFTYDITKEIFSSFVAGTPISAVLSAVADQRDPLNPLTSLMGATFSDNEKYYHRIFLEIDSVNLETPPAQRMTVATDSDGNTSIIGVITTEPVDDDKVGVPVGNFFMTLPELTEGEYEIAAEELASVSFLDNTTGTEWIANKECIDEDPLCLCSGAIIIDYADNFEGGLVEGRLDIVLVDSDNVTITKELMGTFSAVR